MCIVQDLEDRHIDEDEDVTNKGLKSSISMWFERWFLSTNAKDIGTLYLIFALFSGLLGTAFSVLIRMELSGPGVQYIADNQLYNSIITAHAILMIFFMVKKGLYLNNLTTSSKKIFYSDISIENGNNQNSFDKKDNKFKYIKIN